VRGDLIDDLVSARLLSKDIETVGNQQTEVVDIIHETLIANWHRLRGWIDAQRDALQQRVRFEQALDEWLAHNKRDDYLLDGVRLAEAEALEQRGDVALNHTVAQSLLRQSITRRDQARRRRLRQTQLVAALLGILLIAAIAAAATAYQQSNIAEARRRERDRQYTLALARQLAAQSENTEADADPEVLATLRVLLAAESLRRVPTTEGDRALRLALLALSEVRGAGQAARETSTITLPDGPHALAISGDGRIIAGTTWTGQALAIDRQTGTELLRVPDAAVVALSGDGRSLAWAGAGVVRVWDFATRRVVAEHAFPGEVDTLRYSGDKLLVGAQDGTAWRWRPLEAEQDAKVQPQLGDVAMSGDGRVIAEVDGATVHVREAATGRTMARITLPEDEELRSFPDTPVRIVLSADGWLLATARWSDVRVWDTRSGKEIARMPHEHVVEAFGFSPGGMWLGTLTGPMSRDWGADDEVLVLPGGRLRAWEVHSGREVARVGPDVLFDALVISADGHHVVAAEQGGEGTVLHSWQLWPEALLADACARVQWNLSDAEWRYFVGDEQYVATCPGLPKGGTHDVVPGSS
jgi:hypothetical protein